MKRNITYCLSLTIVLSTSVYAYEADSTAIYRNIDLDEVIVSVNRGNTRKINSPQHIVKIPKDYINYTNKQSVADLLNESGQILV